MSKTVAEIMSDLNPDARRYCVMNDVHMDRDILIFVGKYLKYEADLIAKGLYEGDTLIHTNLQTIKALRKLGNRTIHQPVPGMDVLVFEYDSLDDLPAKIAGSIRTKYGPNILHISTLRLIYKIVKAQIDCDTIYRVYIKLKIVNYKHKRKQNG